MAVYAWGRAARIGGKVLRLAPRRFLSDETHPTSHVSRLYPELEENIISKREKDMPLPDMENPFQKEKAQCILCKLKIVPDYKNVKLLSQFVSPYTGNVYGRHISGLCKAQQERIEEEISKARRVGLMAYYLKEVEFLHDPHLYDPERPIRPHRF